MPKANALYFSAIGSIPNSDLPLLVMETAIPASAANSTKVEKRFAEHGWRGTWTYTVFDYWHFHVEGHEVLACVAGEASIGFGGDKADGGIAFEMKPGDVVIVPAGVGHKRLDGTSDFQVAGAYPPGQNGGITKAGEMTIENARGAISRLPDPKTDPVDGRPFRWTSDQASAA